jgi:hypothetical protein
MTAAGCSTEVAVVAAGMCCGGWGRRWARGEVRRRVEARRASAWRAESGRQYSHVWEYGGHRRRNMSWFGGSVLADLPRSLRFERELIN